MTPDRRLGRMATNILAVRAERRSFFPSEIFDEYAWDMLMLLFVAHVASATVSEADLFVRIKAPPPVGHRWLAHLGAAGLVAPRADGDDVALSADAIAQMRTFLETASRIHWGE